MDSLKEEIDKLEKVVSKENFWDNQEESAKILQQLNSLKLRLEKYYKLQENYNDLEVLIELGIEENDENIANEANKVYKVVLKGLDTFETETLLDGKYDKNNAIVTLHPGAGGTESHDWTEMLYRMYVRWADQNGFVVNELDYLDGDVAGIKSVTFEVVGENAYGYLKCEKGVHRLVRISPFDSSGRRHTSFAALEVVPEIADDVELEINSEDLRIDTYRASGAGGQHVNKTDSAIRITHIPTGIVVSCQNERSQLQNKETAMKMLKSKLLELKEQEHKDKIEDLKGTKREIAWGSQIRSYVFHPYSMVKDHRTNCETGNVASVMDGDLNKFIQKYLRKM